MSRKALTQEKRNKREILKKAYNERCVCCNSKKINYKSISYEQYSSRLCRIQLREAFLYDDYYFDLDESFAIGYNIHKIKYVCDECGCRFEFIKNILNKKESNVVILKFANMDV